MSQHRLQDDINKQVAVGDALDFGTDGIKADVIAESTSAGGVTIDGVVCKDSAVTASGGVTAAITGNVTGNVTGNLDGAVTVSSVTYDVDAVTSAGGNQATATAITGPFTVITAGNNAVGAVLPSATAGLAIKIVNPSANGALIYPAAGDAINALGANNAIEMATVTAAEFVASNNAQWWTFPTVPS